MFPVRVSPCKRCCAPTVILGRPILPIRSPAAAFLRNAERQAEQDGDGNWNCFAELGFGLNPAITRLSGNPVFDEKATETLHIAFGDNSGFGHNVFAKTHQDLVVRKPTLLLDGTPVIQKGEVLLEAIEIQRQNILPTEQALSPSCSVALRENHCAVHNSALRRRLFAGNRIGYVNISPQRYGKVLADLHKALGTYGRVRVATLDRDYPHFEGVNTSELLQIMLHYRMLDAHVE